MIAERKIIIIEKESDKMNINNIAIVRATNIIPFDGIIRAISNTGYLCKSLGGEFSSTISSLLEELKILPEQDYTKIYIDEDYYDNYIKICSSITKEYLPYTSDYNSIVLFSLNGICPDDNEHGFANNTFSNKNCAIIEPLKYHIDDVISLVPTDTSVKGDVYLSSEAIILIEDTVFQNLTSEEKNKLQNFNVKIFKGNLKDAIKETLKETGKYTAEDLSLSQSTGGIKDSPTSDELKECINIVIKEYNLSNLKYYNLITARNDLDIPKYDMVKDEYHNAVVVYEYYIEKFLQELLDYFSAPDNLKIRLHSSLYNKRYMKEIKELIRKIGINNYKSFLDNYNKKLEEERINKSLQTPEEIMLENKKSKAR